MLRRSGILLVGLLAVLLAGLRPAISAESVIVYTENYPPFSFIGADGEVEGKATAKVHQLLKEAGIDHSIRLLPWARAMRKARSDEDALIFSLIRTPGREEQFDWLARLAESSFYLQARADDMRVFTPETIKSGVYTGSCIANDLACEFFLWTGMPPENIIPIHQDLTGDFQMVVAGRADLYISDISVSITLRGAKGLDPSLTKPVMKLGGKSGYYLAAGMQVSQAIRDDIKSAHARLVELGTYSVVPVHVPLK